MNSNCSQLTKVGITDHTFIKTRKYSYFIMEMIGDSEILDEILGDSIPQEINKAKIKEIFEILQSQERPDLVNELKSFILLKKHGENGSKPVEAKSQEGPDLAKEMKNLVLPNSSRERGLKLVERKDIEHSSINKVDELPTEILKKILQKLNVESLFLARQTCRRWKEIIDRFEFLGQASSKFLKSSFDFLFFVSIIFIFRYNFLHTGSWRE